MGTGGSQPDCEVPDDHHRDPVRCAVAEPYAASPTARIAGFPVTRQADPEAGRATIARNASAQQAGGGIETAHLALDSPADVTNRELKSGHEPPIARRCGPWPGWQ